MSWFRAVAVPAAMMVALGGEAMAVEEAKYEVLERDGKFELRQYAPQIVAETLVEGDFDGVGNEGFRRLAAYIFGKNRDTPDIAMTAPVNQEPAETKIAMTAPVNQEREDGSWRITFVMPAEYTMETLPKPVDERVRLREVPGQRMAALKYSGTWGEDRYRDRESQLMGWVDERGLKPKGPPVFARYNAPFVPWFLRRNEVLIPVEG